jgi:hypothetical protein
VTKVEIKKLDVAFSKYIRNKYAKNGMVECYTCGRQYEVSKIQCGHFWSRKHQSVRWHEDNARPQCYSCNVMQYGRQFEFGNKLKIEIGELRFDILEKLKNTSAKSFNFDFKELLQRFE